MTKNYNRLNRFEHNKLTLHNYKLKRWTHERTVPVTWSTTNPTPHQRVLKSNCAVKTVFQQSLPICLTQLILRFCYLNLPILVAQRSKQRVWVRSLAGIAGSNPAGDKNVSLFWVLHVVRYRSLWWADPSSRGGLPTVVCRVWNRSLKNEAALTHVGLLQQRKEIIKISLKEIHNGLA